MGAIGKIINGEYVQFANDKKGGTAAIPNLEPDKVLVSSSDGTVTASEISADKLGMLSNVTSDIQQQIDDLSDRIGEEGGLGGVPLGDCNNLGISRGINMFSLNWTDPENVVFNGETLAEWDGTKVVRKKDTFPAGVDDGVLVVDSKVKNAYAETALEDSDFESGGEYCYTLFPYTNKNVYTMSDNNKLSATAITVSDVLSENTWETIALVSESGEADQIWNVGDTKDGYTIIGFDHDNLSDGSGKAGITFWMNRESDKITTSQWSSSNTWYMFMYSGIIRNSLENQLGYVDEEIKNHIKEVSKSFVYKSSGSASQITYNWNAVKLFLLSCAELGDTTKYKEGTAYEGIEQYKSFSSTYWTRTPKTTDSSGGYAVGTEGSIISGYWNSNYTIRYAFCI